jgi:hypothetical protein
MSVYYLLRRSDQSLFDPMIDIILGNTNKMYGITIQVSDV